MTGDVIGTADDAVRSCGVGVAVGKRSVDDHEITLRNGIDLAMGDTEIDAVLEAVVGIVIDAADDTADGMAFADLAKARRRVDSTSHAFIARRY